MTYAKRNNLTIAGILIVLVIVAFVWYRSEAKALDRVLRENNELNRQLQDDIQVSDTFGEFQVMRDSLEQKLVHSSKKLINAKEPTFSLSYINWLIETYNIELDFDFQLNQKRTGKRYTTFVYTLNGEGDYHNFSSLIWYITHNPILYNIRNVNLKRSDSKPDLLHFTVMFEGYSLSEAWESGDDLAMVSTKINWDSEFGYDAFSGGRPAPPRPKREAKKKVSPAKLQSSSLIDVETASLIAIANNKIYLRAKSTGKVVSLKVGDRVRNGQLARINQSLNQAAFRVSTPIGSRMVYLKLEYN
ncbi:MAG: type 4a pilus biogenesis protein PilO [bacterium]